MSYAVEIGDVGEVKFTELLKAKQRYLNLVFVQDLCLPRPGKMPTQIDFLVFSTKGFYCIELKNWNGVVTCDDSAKHLFVRYSSKKIKISNPISQNKIHMKTLEEQTGYKFQNRIVMLGQKEGESKYIFTMEEFFEELSKGEDIYSLDFVKATYEKFKVLKNNGILESYSRNLFIDYQIENAKYNSSLKR